MFTAFDENTFWKAIEEKEYLRLKVNAVSAMLDDPTFARGEAEKVLQILQERVPEIFEEEVHLEYEERLEKADWDKRYFTKLTYWFQENFALNRVAYIKIVGKVVHADTEAAYNESLRLNAAHKAPIVNKPATNKAPVSPKPTSAPAVKAPATPKTPAQNAAQKKSAAAPTQVQSPAKKTVTKEPSRSAVTNPPKAPEKSEKQALKMIPVVATIAAVCALVLGIALLLKILLA